MILAKISDLVSTFEHDVVFVINDMMTVSFTVEGGLTPSDSLFFSCLVIFALKEIIGRSSDYYLSYFIHVSASSVPGIQPPGRPGVVPGFGF